MDKVSSILHSVVLFILSISTIISILDLVGWMPAKFKKRMIKNRSEETLEVLRNLGIDVDKYKKINASMSFPKDYSEKSLIDVIRKNMDIMIINKSITIGEKRPVMLTKYYDLMGYTCNPYYAEQFARFLSSYWSHVIKNDDNIKNPIFDFIVTPKRGSPILGYEFAKLIQKPFVIHDEDGRFLDNDKDCRKYFNCDTVPPVGATALVVNDSTAGGDMGLETIYNLRKYGYVVTNFLVVFKLKNKDAKNRLKESGVYLSSIIKTEN